MTRILVIDDNNDLRTIMQHMLEPEGHEVVLAADGAEGLKLQRECPAALVITDIFMPNKEGIETIRELREEYPNTIIIAMSGGGRLRAQDYLLIANELGVVAILRKPFAMTVLIEAVRAALQPSNH